MKKTASISFKTEHVNGLKVFYRETGDLQAPAVLLLHGFPTSSHMFRNLIPQLAGDYHVVAPDLPGFGFSDAPDHQTFQYTFDHLAEVIGDFIEQIGLKRFAVYVFDYGAPVGLRLALRYPDRISALISQTATPMLRVSATLGRRFVPTGKIRARRTGRLCASSPPWKPPAGNITTA
jgi:pimeloyl-ACP methyl ester carboxylesterase